MSESVIMPPPWVSFAPVLSPSDVEAMDYYVGLPSSPRLLARTSTTPWVEPNDLGGYRKLKQLRVVINHKLNTTWENDVAPKVHACLDEMGVRWTSTDIVRIGLVGESSAPVVLWIGVTPKSLASENANTAAFRCLDILKEFDITDVDVEIRESSVTRLAGPKLLPPVLSYYTIMEAARHPLTHALGLSISAQATPYVAGTGGFFMAESNDSDKLLLITARHVVLPPNKVANVKFECKNGNHPRSNVLLLGEEAYGSCLASIKTSIREQEFTLAMPPKIKMAEKTLKELYTLYNDINKNWGTYASRVLGHVVCSPPICLGAGTVAEQYTEDYAIIKVDDKIDRTQFTGNVVDIGLDILMFIEKMYSNPRNATSFQYPIDHLIPLRGTISDEEMRHPTLLDKNGEPCLTVIKDGSSTGVTIGRASGIMSYVREYSDDGSHQTSKEWAILPYNTKSGAFSAPGDSGAVVIDGLGRIGGLLTGGSGVTASSDISYATPITFLLKSIKANGYPDAHLNLA